MTIMRPFECARHYMISSKSSKFARLGAVETEQSALDLAEVTRRLEEKGSLHSSFGKWIEPPSLSGRYQLGEVEVS